MCAVFMSCLHTISLRSAHNGGQLCVADPGASPSMIADVSRLRNEANQGSSQFVDTFPPVISSNGLEIKFPVHISANKGHPRASL